MAKKILILESSATMQKLFTKNLDSRKYSIRFEADSKEIFSTLTDFCPDLFLINCNIKNPTALKL